jgi:hypothetical protein
MSNIPPEFGSEKIGHPDWVRWVMAAGFPLTLSLIVLAACIAEATR